MAPSSSGLGQWILIPLTGVRVPMESPNYFLMIISIYKSLSAPDLGAVVIEKVVEQANVPVADIDEVIIGHTNEPEYRKLQNNEFMEALRDRTVKIDVPYITKLGEEVKIYRKDWT